MKISFQLGIEPVMCPMPNAISPPNALDGDQFSFVELCDVGTYPERAVGPRNQKTRTPISVRWYQSER